jgi:hypothetical protein
MDLIMTLFHRAGTVIFFVLNGAKTGPSLSGMFFFLFINIIFFYLMRGVCTERYFQLKGFTPDQKKGFIHNHRGAYA